MGNNSVTELKKPDSFVDDPITDILRQGARKLLSQALEAEVEFFRFFRIKVENTVVS